MTKGLLASPRAECEPTSRRSIHETGKTDHRKRESEPTRARGRPSFLSRTAAGQFFLRPRRTAHKQTEPAGGNAPFPSRLCSQCLAATGLPPSPAITGGTRPSTHATQRVSERETATACRNEEADQRAIRPRRRVRLKGAASMYQVGTDTVRLTGAYG